MPDQVPTDVIRHIALILAQDSQQRTLAALARTSWNAYYATVPLLYAHLTISAHGAAAVLGLGDVAGFTGFEEERHGSVLSPCHVSLQALVGDKDGANGRVLSAEATGEDNEKGRDGLKGDTPNHGVDPSTLRRLSALAYVKHITLRSLPPDNVCSAIAAAAEQLEERTKLDLDMDVDRDQVQDNGDSKPAPEVLIFPRLESISLEPQATDQLRQWTPDDYSRPRNPPLLEALSASSAPRHLCIAFRLVPSADWETHRDLTVPGQHQLVRRIGLLAAKWTQMPEMTPTCGVAETDKNMQPAPKPTPRRRLDSITYHDLVFQVPPCVSSVRNIYNFAPHVIPHPYIPRRYRFPSGRGAVRLPGPEWNIRPWQMCLPVKQLLPSGGDHHAALSGTSWVFCNVPGHILTKEARDDDDTSGVWWEEVDGMVRSSVVVGLGRDLPAREGVDGEVMSEVWERIEYGKVAVCDACHRDVDEHPVMGLDGL